MKTHLETWLVLALWLLACSPIVPAASPGRPAANWVVRQFHEVDTLLANPGQGWMTQSLSPGTSPRFPCSVVYIRFNWADVEPEPGKFDWQIIDEVLAAWKRRGTVAFRVMTCNAHSEGYYTSPKWLFDSGCKGFEYVVGGDDPTSGGKRIPRIEPDYSDPIYLARHGEFLKAWGERYDGNPGVEFLDIGSYGIWGEWHTTHPAPVEVRKQIVDLYLKAFHRTPMVFMSDDAEVLKYALAHGTGFRRDGVGSPWHEQSWIGSKKYAGVPDMAEAWQRAPVVFEWFGDYEYFQSKGWSFDAAVNFMLRNHVTLINDNIGRFPPEALPQLEKLARLAGARLVLREIAHEKKVSPGRQLHLQMKWVNTGVGKLYWPYSLQFTLTDSSGRVCFRAGGKADPRQWLPGEHSFSESLQLPTGLPSAEYALAVGLVDPAGQRRPFLLPIDAPEVDGRYTVSRLTIQ